ncbi:Protein of uncharacterised function (DUF1446) [Achromobacter spanius]|uniref:acyclic terpene utilization AtuA family protein n=1 Tax=Achromobacter spanius TaxID=217203 RepID=UPI000C2B877C|nr:acyclic terpene utilization AtuA family protein [Achromobacter spanius]AUA54770.1 ABC transporter substrate-binding protein [Achromobacter spanius]CAB3635441.1 hypothetical protein LMG5911_01210 [Achromobacter spanius]SPT39617.1 Protein of uncharacterised function (DUF1446) [Achromobacter denitrificans]VEE57822.1 Protein of uncharacterised function (DUF1446) [Achromobacter spanius]
MKNNATTLRIGSGAGWWGDRIDPARWNAERGELDFLCFETMAEATVSAAQVRKRRDPAFPGYDTWLDDRMRAVLPHCMKRGTRIISNQGWINPRGAAQRIAELCAEAGWSHARVAAVSATDLSATIAASGATIMESGAPVASIADSLISAEPYAGAAAIVQALDQGADIVVTGRVADPSLFLAPMMHHFGWRDDDWDRLGQGSGIGHLLECGAQVTGGYFSDPGYKDVPQPWNLAFPYADVQADGTADIGKVDGTGGCIDLRTVKEQMFYEVHDPARYITPDVVVDFTGASLVQTGPDRVRVSGIAGHPRTSTLKVSLGCAEGYIGEDMFFFAGPGCLDKARLAETILRERLRIVGLRADALRIDFIGVNAVHGAASSPSACEPAEVAVRIAARSGSRAEAEKIGREVDGMAVCGLASTGKRVPHQDRVREVIGLWSALTPRESVQCTIDFV